MKKYVKLIILCSILVTSVIETKAQNIVVDKKVDSIIRLSIRQNLFYSNADNPILDNKGLIYDFPCENWKLRIGYLKRINNILPGYYGLIVFVRPFLICNGTKILHSSDIFYGFNTLFKVLFIVKEIDFELIIASANIPSKAFVRSRYAHVFNLTEKTKNYSDFIPYIKLQMYFKNLRNIKYLKKNRKWIYFSAIEKILGKDRKIYIKINRRNVNEVIYLGWKTSGKYKDKEKIELL